MANDTDSKHASRVTLPGQQAFGDWPAGGLERVAACPLCGNGARSTLHEGLEDHAFKSAPGKWTLRRCGGCGCGYLDPRPDSATIGLAYDRYYTHKDGPADSGLVRLWRRIADAYSNDRYGTACPNGLPGGHHLVKILPRMRRYLDVSLARHLGKASGENTRLLDIGCGNGAFLQFAAHLGWSAEGIDNDAAAVAMARAAGCNATHGSLDELPLRKGHYRHVTLNHVVEHVHDPVKLLRQCFDVLVPGGRLWLETPNLRSIGHDVFGPAWRGLEPPRHLVLFDRPSLTSTLAGAGFSGIEFRVHPGVSAFMWLQSRSIAREIRGNAPPRPWKLLATLPGALIAEYLSAFRPDKSEFLTCIAFRDGQSGRATS